ncbi:unnamed protein product [Durusdinium trenchii]|uniref:Uncharacterized protein n=1 Tax=Durusdinium trenchii TaxID=1381693 RepID=A0ABP0LD91_9DINO
MMQNPESKMEGQVHWPDQEGCYAGCAADSMAGGKTYGSLTPPHFFKEPDEEAEVPDAPGAPLPSGALAPRRQKVCDMLGRITGAYQGKFCQGPDACVTALPRDFGQVTGATFCPKGDCGEKAGRPWCVSPQFLKLYDGPIEINCKASGRGTTEQALAEDASIHSNHQKQLVEEDFWGCQLSSLQPPALRLCLEQLEDQGLFQ